MGDEMLEVIRAEIAMAIGINVNGKIDKMQKCLDTHNLKHEQDMQRMMPIIEAFEEGQRDLHSAQKAGKGILWISGFITAIGGTYLVIRNIFG